jgi:hypothetical protein
MKTLRNLQVTELGVFYIIGSINHSCGLTELFLFYPTVPLSNEEKFLPSGKALQTVLILSKY